MPELPEVEVIRCTLHQALAGQTLISMETRSPKLRYAIASLDTAAYAKTQLKQITRKAKYMLWEFNHSAYLLHLGMSGHMRLCDSEDPWQKHEHIQWHFEKSCVRLIDPRRFGCWVEKTPYWDKKLQAYGPDPLENWDILQWFDQHRHRHRSIYRMLMDQHVISGIGNIYAQEALFASNIHPEQSIHSLSKDQILQLGSALQGILISAIASGGTTLNDHRKLDGTPGYFQITLQVYGKNKTQCSLCRTHIQSLKISGRTVAFCPRCQLLCTT